MLKIPEAVYIGGISGREITAMAKKLQTGDETFRIGEVHP